MSLIDNILQAEIYTYRLNDGSYIVAEEINVEQEEDTDNDDFHHVSITCPAALFMLESGIVLTDWNFTDVFDITELNPDNIVSRSEAPVELKIHYFKYVAKAKLRQEEKDESFEELLSLLDEYDKSNNDAFDKLDSFPYSKRWEWSPNNNN